MLGLIVVNRSWSRNVIHALRSPNRAFWWVIAGAVGFLILVLYVPSLRNLFRFSTLHTDDLLICVGAGLLSSLVIELLKFKHFRK
jgi:Ca2+-transporting ATPase